MFNEERIKDLEESKSFLNKVRLCSQLGVSNNNMYISFLILLAKCKNKLICQEEVYNCLKYDIFSDHPNLLKEFERLFMTETSEGINPSSFISSRHIIKIHAEESDPRKVLEVKQNQCSIQDAKGVVPNLSKQNIEKKIKFPMTRAGFSSFETCTPSYQVLLKNCPENPVLNNCVRLVAPSSTFHPPIRSKAVVALDAVEDDLYMQDMLLEHLKSATKNVEELLKVLDETDQLALTTLSDLIKEYLTAQNLRCIENLYGEHGLDMIEALHVNPWKALEAISLRLKQKLRTLGLN